MTEIRIEIGAGASARRAQIKHGFILQCVTVAWNVFEGGIALFAGLSCGSVALVGFGVDSLIETASAVIVGLRLWQEHKQQSTENIEGLETRARKTAGTLLFALAAFVLFDSVRHLGGFADHAKDSMLGLVLTMAALIVMPILARAKLRVAERIGSQALRADAMETVCCAWLAGTTLLGLVLNTVLHWWWADALAGLVIMPLLVREGLEAIKGEECGCHGGCE